MAGSSVIGALRVDLGLNSAQFSAGLRNAQTGLAKFGNVAARSLTFLAAGAVAAGGALALAVKGSIDHADALSKSAQKAGLTVEALSRLEYAAKLSDVSLEGLTGGLQKLSKSMIDVASGKGPATAFQALGISVKEADGTLRSSSSVFADVADRFSRMEDGATKTALAIQIFGKSGAELIPLLNSGRQGLANMADESDRLGATISTKTAKAAERFNDTLTTIGQAMQGVVNKVMEAALPALQSLADTLASPEFAAAAQAMAKSIIDAISTTIKEFKAAIQWAENFKNALTPDTDTILKRWAEQNGGQLPDWAKNHGTMLASGSAGTASSGTGASGTSNLSGFKPLKIKIIDETAVKASAAAAKEALKSVNEELDVMNDSLQIQRDEWEKLQEPLRNTISAVGDSLSSALGGVITDLIHGKDAVSGLIDAFGQLGDKLIQMALDQAIQGLLGTLLGAFGGSYGGIGSGLTGAATYGFSGNGVYGIPGFASGGSGVIPGAGGSDSQLFMAKVTPGEAFAFGDDAVNGMRGGGTNLTVKIDARGAQVGVAEQLDQWARLKLPALVNRISRDPYAVG